MTLVLPTYSLLKQLMTNRGINYLSIIIEVSCLKNSKKKNHPGHTGTASYHEREAPSASGHGRAAPLAEDRARREELVREEPRRARSLLPACRRQPDLVGPLSEPPRPCPSASAQSLHVKEGTERPRIVQAQMALQGR